MIVSYRDLEVYKKSYQLSLEIHQESLKFPEHEMRELGYQIRKATKSIPMNIAEGYGKKDSIDEFKRYLKISLGSCDEVQVQLEYCKDLKYITQEVYESYRKGYEEVGKMIVGMLKKWIKI